MRLLDHLTRGRRSEGLDEAVNVATQEGAPAEGQAGHVDAEEVAGVERAQVAVAIAIEGDGGHHAHAHAQLDIGLDDVGVHG